MLEILYNKNSMLVRGWRGNEKDFGAFKPKKDEAVVLLPIQIPTVDSDIFTLDLSAQKLLPNPEYIPPQDEAEELVGLYDNWDTLTPAKQTAAIKLLIKQMIIKVKER